MLVFAAGAQAAITASNITSPADGTLLFQNYATNAAQTYTVTGTSNGSLGDLFDIDCFQGSSLINTYRGESTNGIALTSNDGSFSVSVPQSLFYLSGSCHLLAVPHGTSAAPSSGYSGPRVGFSFFEPEDIAGGPNNGTPYDYYFDDATLAVTAQEASADNCGPYVNVVDGTSAMNQGPRVFDCTGSIYAASATGSGNTLPANNDLDRDELEVDGSPAYGSYAASELFSGSTALAGFPALSVSVDSFNSANGDAQTTESEPLVSCTPTNAYEPTSANCTGFASTGVTFQRVTDFTDNAQVQTVTDTFTSTDGQSHRLDLIYETDVPAGSPAPGWELPGQSSFITPNTGDTGPAPSAPGTVEVETDPSAGPSFADPVGALTFASPYNSVRFDDSLWSGYDSALFDDQRTIPAGGSTSITWSYATATSVADLAGEEDDEQPAVVAIAAPAAGATETSSPVTVTGTASAGSGVKSVTVNGVGATVTGDAWSATIPLTAGHNTITATVTSSAGNTATATTTVTYVPPAATPPPSTTKEPALSLKSRTFNGKSVLVKLVCAASGSQCAGTIAVRYTEAVKKHKVTVVVASKRYSIAVGHTATVTAALTPAGKKLLKARGKLAVAGTVTVTESGGASKPAATFKLTLKKPKKR
jgi:hypothetical protein